MEKKEKASAETQRALRNRREERGKKRKDGIYTESIEDTESTVKAKGPGALGVGFGWRQRMAGGCGGILDELEDGAALGSGAKSDVAGLQGFGAVEMAEGEFEDGERAEIAFVAGGNGALIEAEGGGAIGGGFAFGAAGFENGGEAEFGFGIFALAQNIAIKSFRGGEVTFGLLEFREMLEDEEMVGTVLEAEFVVLAGQVGVAAMQLDFAEHGAAPGARLRQRALCVSDVESLLQHVGGFLEIAAHFRDVREARPGGEARGDFVEMAVVGDGGVEVSGFESTVTGNSQEIRTFWILRKALLG
jgi:hypothetical protein